MAEVATVETLTVDVGGRPVTATVDQWEAAVQQVADYKTAKRKEWQEQQRAAGQVWVAEYMRYHQPYKEECFSFEDARSLLIGGEDAGEMSAQGVRNPDGSFTEYSWEWLPD